MISFIWPWLILALPLPLLVRRLMPPVAQGEEAALRVPFMDGVQISSPTTMTNGRGRWRLALASVIWLLLVLAAMRPQWLGEAVELPISGRDLMLAVDLSGSMQEQDFVIDGEAVDRLTATKMVATDFIRKRVGDRLGLILFGERAYLQTPLTFDRETVVTLLLESAIGLAGKKTAIGDAIGLAVKRLKDNPQESRVVILLTDGANTAGVVDPVKAAGLAAQKGLTIYTIGIGADEMIVRSLFGSQRVNPSRDLDETALKKIAQQTGGRYFRAHDTKELEQIYAIIDQLEPLEQEQQLFHPKRALFHWPLGIALILGLLLGTPIPAGWRAT
ncbi:MAG: VWA domain-containing protein [Gammaproteobacteria bacterium]|nr:VWA domain-containing protein [Gammaproteobacteria bacterium]